MWQARSIGSVPMRQILRKDRPRSWSVLRIDQLHLAWSPPEWVVGDLTLLNRRSPPLPHGISNAMAPTNVPLDVRNSLRFMACLIPRGGSLARIERRKLLMDDLAYGKRNK